MTAFQAVLQAGPQAPAEAIGRLGKKTGIVHSFSRVEMSPISSPHSWARKTRRMILPERV